MKRKSHVTPRERALLARARAVPQDLIGDLELLRFCFMTPEEFDAFVERLVEEVVMRHDAGTLGLFLEGLYAVVACLRLGLAGRLPR